MKLNVSVVRVPIRPRDFVDVLSRFANTGC